MYFSSKIKIYLNKFIKIFLICIIREYLKTILRKFYKCCYIKYAFKQIHATKHKNECISIRNDPVHQITYAIFN